MAGAVDFVSIVARHERSDSCRSMSVTDKKQTVHVPLEPMDLAGIDAYIAGQDFPLRRCHVMQIALRRFLTAERKQKTVRSALGKKQ